MQRKNAITEFLQAKSNDTFFFLQINMSNPKRFSLVKALLQD